MPADQWQPPQTGDRILDRSFADLAARLAGMDATLEELSIPTVRIARASVQVGDELYAEYRGPGGHVVTLPPASTRGTGRGALVTIQNTGLASITVRAFAQDTLNTGTEVTLSAGSGALCSSNGVDHWTALVSGSSLIIQNHDVDQSPQRPRLNFTGDIVVTDNPGNDSTDIDVTAGGGLPMPGTGMFLSGVWYAPNLITDAASTKLVYAAPTPSILYAVPTCFPIAGTITDLAVYVSGNGGGSTKQYIALYRSNASNTAPDARIFSGEFVGTNFSPAKHEFNSVGITVDAGELIWFASVGSPSGSTGPQTLAMYPSSMQRVLGTTFDGTGGTDPVRNLGVGYAYSFTYGQPPDPWTDTTIMLAGNYSANGAGISVFKFTPS